MKAQARTASKKLMKIITKAMKAQAHKARKKVDTKGVQKTLSTMFSELKAKNDTEKEEKTVPPTRNWQLRKPR